MIVLAFHRKGGTNVSEADLGKSSPFGAFYVASPFVREAEEEKLIKKSVNKFLFRDQEQPLSI